MRNRLKQFKSRALARPDVKREYDRIAEEFEFLGEILKARVAAGLTQADIAARIGTTQSAVARLESAVGRHSPSIATLQRYASALGVPREAPSTRAVTPSRVRPPVDDEARPRSRKRDPSRGEEGSRRG